MKKFLLGVLVGFLFAVVAAAIAGLAFIRLATRPPSIPDNAVLVLRIKGPVPERAGVETPFSGIPFIGSQGPPTVRDYWELFKKASADPRIRAILVAPEGVEAGWAKLDELRAGIEGFRKAGKPAYAWLQSPRTRDYYLATAAERVYMGPEDVLDLKGLRVEMMYFRRTLDKLGVEVVIAHAGEYKDAPEAFTRTEPSQPSLEMTTSLLNGIYGHLVSVIGGARKKSADEVQAVIDQGPFLAPQARSAGLVDALKYRDEVIDELKARLKAGDIGQVRDTDYIRVPLRDAGLRPRSRIAFIAAEGMIVRSSGDSLLGGGGFLGADEMRRRLRKVRDDGSIRGAIVRIDSPGGDSFASDEIWREMQLLARKKPLVISMSDEAASGGYYIAMTGDPILAYPGTYTGSIGVFYGKANLRRLYDKVGITKRVISRGRFADIDSDYVPLSPAGRAKLEQFVQENYQSFLSRVSNGRKLPMPRVEELAQGRVWLGSQARENGLVDELGGIDRAVAAVKQKAGIPRDEQVWLVSYPARRSLLDWMLGPPADPELEALVPLRRISTVQWLRGSLFYMAPFTIGMR